MARRRLTLSGALVALALAALSLLAGSCVKVLSLADHKGAADELCALLELCFGADQYPDCREHVASGLEGSEPEARTSWLGDFSGAGDCLLNCSNAKACLDALPICHGAGDGCGQAEHCCGFLDGLSACGGSGICCFQDKTPCSSDGECCTGSCNQGTCGEGRPCSPVDAPCIEDGECCSSNCSDGRCDSVCKVAGEPCGGDGECCGQICDGNVCACLLDSTPCVNSAECCSNFCDPTSSLCSNPGACGVLHDPCLGPSDCCLPLFACGPEQQCCQTVGTACANPSDCCTDGCSTVTGTCCNGYGNACGAPSDCCRGTCSSGTCACMNLGDECKTNGDCCSGYCKPDDATNTTASCADACPHSVCCVGPKLSTSSVSSMCMYAGEATCIATVCSSDPWCCTVEWDAMCVTEAQDICGIDCANSPCSLDTPQPI